MTFHTWLQIIEKESQTPGQHAGPTGVGNLPQPKERGGDLDYAELLALEQRQKELRSTPNTPSSQGRVGQLSDA